MSTSNMFSDKPGRGLSPSLSFIAITSILLLAAPVVGFGYWWFWCRIEPGPGQMAILTRKTGHDLPSGQIIATEKGQKGIQLDVLAEGRFFKNPFDWGWEMAPLIDIPAGKIGVQTRLFGKDLPPGQILASEGTKGILREVLGLGKHRINPYAYSVEVFDATTIHPGCVGVATSLVGTDVLTGDVPAESRNGFIVKPGMKGVLEEVLDPGTYYLNPYVTSLTEINLQSQRFEMSGADSISFLTLDGFTVAVEGTIEYAIDRDKAAWITHRVGSADDVSNDFLTKVVLPRARGFSRMEGSKYPANNFIVGETRQLFQNNLEMHLREKCAPWGVQIRSVLIRNIQVPEDIASVIREREVAVQNALKFEQQIIQAKSKAELTRQETLALQSKEKVDAETAKLRAVIAAKQDQAVKLTLAQQQLEVAKVDNEAATFKVQAMLSAAEAERDVIRLSNEAEAGVITTQTKAFGGGLPYARYLMYQKLGPQIQSILSTDEASGLGGLFRPFIPDAPSPRNP